MVTLRFAAILAYRMSVLKKPHGTFKALPPSVGAVLTLDEDSRRGKKDRPASKAAKELFYFTLVLALYGTTFIPHTKEWVYWKPWIDSYLYVLAMIGGGALLYAFRPIDRMINFLGNAIGRARRVPNVLWVSLAFFLFFCLTYYLSGKLFEHFPTEADSMAQYVGAKIFAQGHWTIPSHALPHFFDTRYFFNEGKYYTFYPPGHMLILAVGHLIGNPAIINPLLGALSLVATCFLTKEIAGWGAARISLVLFLLSPFIVFLASEYDNRATALLCATLFALFYIKAVKSNVGMYGFISGLAFGYWFMTRPQTAIAYMPPFALYGVWLLILNWRSRWKIFATMTAGVTPFILFFLYFNWQTTGDPLLTGYQKSFGQSVVPGSNFTSFAHWLPEFTRVVVYMQLFHGQFFGWPISSLFLVALLFFFKAQKPFCGLLVMAFFSVFLSLTLTPYTLVIFGPRYLYEISSIVIILTAICLHRMPAIARAYFHINPGLPAWRGLFLGGIVLLVTIALNTTIRALYVEYGHNYRAGRQEFAKKIEAFVQKPALVLMRHEAHFDALLYRQPPDDKNDIIYAHDRGAENSLLIQYYPTRHVYFVHDEQNIQSIP